MKTGFVASLPNDKMIFGASCEENVTERLLNRLPQA